MFGAMRRIIPCLWIVASAHCGPHELPGTQVGVYRVTGNLQDNTCGQTALPARDPLEFGVEIRQQGETGYWVVDKPPGTPGELGASGEFRFHRQTTYVAVQPNSGGVGDQSWQDYAGGAASALPASSSGCVLVTEELVKGQLSAGDAGPPQTLDGVNEITIRPEAGSDCRPALATAGGPFLALPCVARYALTGSSE